MNDESTSFNAFLADKRTHKKKPVEEKVIPEHVSSSMDIFYTAQQAQQACAELDQAPR